MKYEDEEIENEIIDEDSIADENSNDAISFDNDDYDFEEDEDKIKSIKENNIQDIDLSLLLQKTNRILSGDEKISVRDIAVTNNDAPACADCQNSLIYLNFDFAQNLKTLKTLFDYLTLIKGLNYHELSHILFTDYNMNKIRNFLEIKYRTSATANKPGNYIVLGDFCNNLNMLEDCRIENLFYMLYPRARYYFSFCASNIILKDDFDKYTPSQLISCYLVLFGRKFMGIGENKVAIEKLKLSLINRIEKNINATPKCQSDIKNIIKEAERITNDYLISKDVIERLELGYELTLLLNDAGLQLEGFSDVESINSGKTRKGMKQRISDAVDKLKEKLKEMEKQEQKEKSNGNKDKKEDKERDKDAENGKIEKILNEILNDIKEDVQNSVDIQNEIKKEINSLGAGAGEYGGYSGSILEFDKSEMEIKRIENILRRLRGDLSTQIFRFQKKGKVDILSVMKSQKNGNFNIFRKLKQNRVDKSKLGVVFLLDTSGSICANDFKKEISATYCFSKSLENLDNKIEVIEFSSSFRTLKKFNAEGDWKRSFDDGTRVQKPLETAIKDLTLLKRNENIENLFIIVVSDGVFDEDAYKLTPTFEKAKSEGIKTLWICASEYADNPKIQALFNWFFRINHLSDLSAKLGNIIKDIQRAINKQILKQDNFFGGV